MSKAATVKLRSVECSMGSHTYCQGTGHVFSKCACDCHTRRKDY